MPPPDGTRRNSVEELVGVGVGGGNVTNGGDRHKMMNNRLKNLIQSRQSQKDVNVQNGNFLPPQPQNGRKTPVFSSANSNSSTDSTTPITSHPGVLEPNGPMYSSFYGSNGDLKPNGVTNFGPPNGIPLQQGTGPSSLNGPPSSQVPPPSQQQPSLPPPPGSQFVKPESDLATLLKSNGPYNPSVVDGTQLQQQQALPSSNNQAVTPTNSTPLVNGQANVTNPSSSDHFLVNATTTPLHLSNSTTSMSSSTSKFFSLLSLVMH